MIFNSSSKTDQRLFFSPILAALQNNEQWQRQNILPYAILYFVNRDSLFPQISKWNIILEILWQISHICHEGLIPHWATGRGIKSLTPCKSRKNIFNYYQVLPTTQLFVRIDFEIQNYYFDCYFHAEERFSPKYVTDYACTKHWQNGAKYFQDLDLQLQQRNGRDRRALGWDLGEGPKRHENFINIYQVLSG